MVKKSNPVVANNKAKGFSLLDFAQIAKTFKSLTEMTSGKGLARPTQEAFDKAMNVLIHLEQKYAAGLQDRVDSDTKTTVIVKPTAMEGIMFDLNSHYNSWFHNSGGDHSQDGIVSMLKKTKVVIQDFKMLQELLKRAPENIKLI